MSATVCFLAHFHRQNEHNHNKHNEQADMTFAPSFKKVRFWVDQLVREEPECAIFIVGTKSLFFPTTTAQVAKANKTKHHDKQAT